MKMFRKSLAMASAMLVAALILVIQSAHADLASVAYMDPVGEWLYAYQGDADAFGSGSNDALDGTWGHGQSDKWDSTAPGDTLSDPLGPNGTPSTSAGGPRGTSPGGAGTFVDGSTTYLRYQDTGDPESHGWCQNQGACFGATGPTNANRRVYFGHNMRSNEGVGDTAGTSEEFFTAPFDAVNNINPGITISFRARIPDSSQVLDALHLQAYDSADFNSDTDIDGGDFLAWQRGFGESGVGNAAYGKGDANGNRLVDAADLTKWQEQYGGSPVQPGVVPWFEGRPNGRGAPMTNGRGDINIVENKKTTSVDSLIGFSLVTSGDVADTCAVASSGTLCQATIGGGGSGSGGLIMNNLDGNTPSNQIDSVSAGGGQLNILDISDSNLNNWNEFWITMIDNGATAGTTEVNVYMNGSTTPTTFQVTRAANNNGAYSNEDDPYLEFGRSDNAGFGSLDLDFLAYKLGIHVPVAALSASIATVPEPTSLVLVAMGLMGLCGVRRRLAR